MLQGILNKDKVVISFSYFCGWSLEELRCYLVIFSFPRSLGFKTKKIKKRKKNEKYVKKTFARR